MSGVAVLLLLVNAASPLDSLMTVWSASLETTGMHHVLAHQELYWPLTGDRLTRTMELWFSPPRQVCVTYSSPDSQAIVADGIHVWTIVPGNNQALVQPQDPTATWRDTPLGKMLSVESFACSSSAAVHEEIPGVSLSCRNTEGQSEFTEVTLFLPEGEEWPTDVLLVDVSGNITSYAILQWERRPRDVNDEDLFCPAIPEGMEIIHLK